MNNAKPSIGIDISKESLDVSIVSQQRTKHLKVSNSINGFVQIEALMNQFNLPKDTIFIIEATGGYHYGIVYFLLEKGFLNVKVINPSIAKSFAQMNNLRGTKTDKIDSFLLAKLGKIQEFPSYQETKQDIEKKQIVTILIGLRKNIQEQKQRRNHFKHQSKVIPCKNILESIDKILLVLKKEITKLENLLCKLAEDEVKIISSIPGVSQKGAAVISTQLGDINRFKNEKQVIAFSGLDPKKQESGTSIKKRSNISKKGNEVLRTSLFQSAWYIYMQALKTKGDKIFVDFIERLKQKNMHYYQILCAVAHKLLGIIFALLKKQKLYEQNYHFNLTSV